MLIVDDVLVSDDIKKVEFACSLTQCKGACCKEGDLGAPLQEEELPVLNAILHKIRSYLTSDGWATIDKHGAYVLDEEGDFSTPTVRGEACAYAVYDEKNILQCGIEQAYHDGVTSFKKPISCHLYPIRITQVGEYEALNFHSWDICASACTHGQALQIPLYVFLKESLIRKYGKLWYKELVSRIEESDEISSSREV